MIWYNYYYIYSELISTSIPFENVTEMTNVTITTDRDNVQGEKKSLSVAIIDEFYTLDLMERDLLRNWL